MPDPEPSKTEPQSAAPSLAEELKAIPYEPLLPIEKKLIAGSLITGLLLLGILLWASATFFPVIPHRFGEGRPVTRTAR